MKRIRLEAPLLVQLAIAGVAAVAVFALLFVLARLFSDDTVAAEAAVDVERAGAEWTRDGESDDAATGLRLGAGDEIATDDFGRVRLIFPGGTQASLSEGSTLDILTIDVGTGQDLALDGGRGLFDVRDDTTVTAGGATITSDEAIAVVDCRSGCRLVVFDGEASVEIGGGGGTVGATSCVRLRDGLPPCEVDATVDTWLSERLAALEIDTDAPAPTGTPEAEVSPTPTPTATPEPVRAAPPRSAPEAKATPTPSPADPPTFPPGPLD